MFRLVVAFIGSLGADGAARNARVMLDARRREQLVVEALAARMPALPARPLPAGPPVARPRVRRPQVTAAA